MYITSEIMVLHVRHLVMDNRAYLYAQMGIVDYIK